MSHRALEFVRLVGKAELGSSGVADIENLTEHASSNRAHWNDRSDAYQAEHGPQLSESGGMAWGGWQIPEAELGILGDVEGKDILEYGCGAAQWSIALAEKGARPVGLDLSDRQLAHARRLMADAGVEFPLVNASAEDVPLPDESFDIVFCDHGAMSFCDPYRTVPEVARLLRPGGLFAFCGLTPLAEVCWPIDDDTIGEQLVENYFEVYRTVEEHEICFNLPYGSWIRLLVGHGFEVLDLVELRPREDAISSYWNQPSRAWARQWPFEHVWKARRKD